MKKKILNVCYVILFFFPCILFAQSPSQNDFSSGSYQRKAFSFSIKGDYINAIKSIDTAIILNPYNGELRSERASFKKLLSGYTKSEILLDYDSAVILDPTNPYMYRQRGGYFQSLKLYKEAITDLEIAKKLHQDKSTEQLLLKLKKESNLYSKEELLSEFNKVYFDKPILNIQDRATRAQTLNKNEYYEEALKEYDTIIAEQPTVAAHYNTRARIHRSLKQYKESMNDYNTAIELKPKDANLYFMRGLLKAEMFLYVDAIKDYDTAANYDSTIQNVYFNRALDNLILKNNTASINDNNKVISMNHRYTNAYINRAIGERRIGDFVHCFQDYDTILKLWPTYNLGLSNLAWTYLYLGDTLSGMNILNKLLTIHPNSKAGHDRQAMVLYNKANYDECRNMATYMVNNYKELEFIYYQRGQAENKLGSYDDAIEDYNKMIEASVNNPDVMSGDHTMVKVIAYCSIAESKIHQGKLKEAIDNCEKALAIDSNYLQAYNTRGFAQYLAGNFRQAIASCDALFIHKKSDYCYQPLFQYKEEAEKALAETPMPFTNIQWLAPRDNVNNTYKGTLYVAEQKELLLKLRISSSIPISKSDLILYQDMEKINPSNAKVTICNVPSFGTKYIYEYSALVKLPGHLCTYKLTTNNKYSQTLTVSPEHYPEYNPYDGQLFTWNGFAE